MSFVIPTFNLSINIWSNGSGPPAIPRLTPMGNLTYGRRVQVASTGGTGFIGVPLISMNLLLPKLTDIRDGATAGGADVVEAPAGSGRLYDVVYVDDIGKGFANEHRTASLTKHGVWPTPIP